MSRVAASPYVPRFREPRVRDKEYLGWVAQLPCLPCACRGRLTWPVEVAHIKVGFPEAGWRAFGHAEKSHDARTAPLCTACHRGQHGQHQNWGGDERQFWMNLGVYPPAFCAALRGAYEAGTNGRGVIVCAAAGKYEWPDISNIG